MREAWPVEETVGLQLGIANSMGWPNLTQSVVQALGVIESDSIRRGRMNELRAQAYAIYEMRLVRRRYYWSSRIDLRRVHGGFEEFLVSKEYCQSQCLTMP